MEKKLKIGVIGLGAIGNVHVNAFQATSEAEVAAICEIDPARLKSVGDKFDIPGRFQNHKHLLKSDETRKEVVI
jgi:myo-inositol 2-dehydrogenase / D-chiro-inositol 1-dehydrogenase